MVIIAHSSSLPQHPFVVTLSGFSLEGCVFQSSHFPLISLSLSIAIPVELPHSFKTLPTFLVARKFLIHLHITEGEEEQEY